MKILFNKIFYSTRFAKNLQKNKKIAMVKISLFNTLFSAVMPIKALIEELANIKSYDIILINVTDEEKSCERVG